MFLLQASELYIQLSFKHQKEKPEKWMSMWIDPMLKVLALDNKQQINNVIEYILTKLLKKDKEILPYILKQLSTQSDTSKMSSLVTCLHRARVMGLLDKQLESEDSVNKLIDMSVLQQALCHIDDQVRLDAFAFICESNKTTAVVSAWEVHLIKTFLPWNLNSQSPGFRQLLVSQLKKLLYRLKESETMMLRQLKKMNNTADGQVMNEKQSLKTVQGFLSWLTRHLFSCLHPGSSFPRKTTCLTALNLMVDIFGFCVCNEIEGEDFNVLIECLTDTFEDNKIEAYKLLKYLSSLDFMKQDYLDAQIVNALLISERHMNFEVTFQIFVRGHDSVDVLFETALNLAGSTRPLDSTTAAYMFRILLLQAELLPVMTKESKSRSLIISCGQPSLPEISTNQSGRVLHLLTWLMEYLKYQIKMADQSLMSAACSKPLYPTLHSIRYVIQDVSFKYSLLENNCSRTNQQLSTDITNCLPVVQNSSPEGNIPAEVMGNITQTTEGLMPEYLTVCCWRSIKEVSLLLGLLCTNVPVKNTGDQNPGGLMTCEQIDEIGSYFKTQLLESIHRGAFELAYAGFVKMCDMLWRSTIPDLYKRPKLWLSHLMTEIQSVSSKLCATRRSAGVPFYVQALVTTEPLTTGRQCFKQAMTDLIKLALTEESHNLSESKVHSLNILRAMYRDTRLGEDVTPFISGGLQAAILGFKSKFWGICNSSTLLFSALMTRVFGVKRSKDESSMSKKNCQTGKAFFHKYPGLYNFILDLLAEATQNVEEHGTVHLHPSLYPLLMVLARLFPSPLEGTDTTLNLSAFIPYILR
ncbi:Thyroid adenoma-associated protein homolog [Mytilus edulis]|uniref:tRNA (32-2'-O)-methyltransferase regulator THADA n=1 Tax=Mytilus edulis TaxID=6550 RepID=A0A8S3UTZ3_MYTED|nr:Thyroid adenoma-associated protein homolog [Mytilus edulis]